MLLLCDAITDIIHVCISLHIHVLTCVNVPISMGHVTTQNKHYFDVQLSYQLQMIVLLCLYK